MTVKEHGSLDLTKLLEVMSEILSDRYKVQIVVSASKSKPVSSSVGGAKNIKI